MIRQGEGEGSLDLAAVARDDLLLDALGARRGRSGELSDPAVALLRALTREVDAGLDEVLAVPGPCAEVPSLTDRRRRRAVRGSVLAAVLAATLSVGGVSAAVTGDPFAAYRSVVGVLTSHDDLPPNAAQVAHLNRMVTNARALARSGDPGAATALEALRAAVAGASDLPPGQRKVLERKIAALEAGLQGAAAPKAKPEHPAQGGAGLGAKEDGGPGAAPRSDRPDRGTGSGEAKPDREAPGSNDGNDSSNGGNGGDGGRGNGQGTESGTAPGAKGSSKSRSSGTGSADARSGRATEGKGSSSRR